MWNLKFATISMGLGFMFCALILTVAAQADSKTCAKDLKNCQASCNSELVEPKETLKSCNSRLSDCLKPCMATFKKCK